MKEKRKKSSLTKKISDLFKDKGKLKIKNYSFGWIFQDEVKEIIKYSIGNDDIYIEGIEYVVCDKFNSYIIKNDFSIIKNINGKGFPIKSYDNNGDLIAISYIKEKDLEDICYIDKDSDLDDMYSTLVKTKSEDIMFELMVSVIL